jgi:hypothetical protein
MPLRQLRKTSRQLRKTSIGWEVSNSKSVVYFFFGKQNIFDFLEG